MRVSIYNIWINQGASFDALTVVLAGDYTAWSPKGEIRNNYLTLGGALKASFTFDPLVLGQATMPDGTIVSGTILKPLLSAAQTAALPLPLQSETWVYDIELKKPNDQRVIRVMQGRVEISPEVTL